MAGETSLARQLRKLAVPQTSLLLQNKVRASLLFDPKEASALDRDTVFQFGVTGFDKLVHVNPLFSKFDRIFFCDSSKTFERSIQSKDANRKLDQKINEFLIILSPYVLLRGAHEALEWLVYRFHIHMFNVDSLVSCVIPYYHSRLFVRVLQLIDLSSPSSRWHWLLPTKKSGEPLKLGVLLHQFNSDLSFRRVVCDFVSKSLSIFQNDLGSCLPVLSFSLVTAFYSVKQCSNINESFVTFLLPYVLKGLKSDFSPLQGGVYAILGVLVSKAKLSNEVIDALLMAISKNFLLPLLTHGLKLIALICELQEIKKLPNKVFVNVTSDRNLPVLYGLLNGCCNVNFGKLLLKKTIPLAFKKTLLMAKQGKKHKLKLVTKLIEVVNFNESLAKICFNMIMKYFKKHRMSVRKNKQLVKKLNNVAKTLLSCLERFWPSYFDGAIESHFAKSKNAKDKIKWKLVMRSVSSLRHHLLPDSGVTLCLAINHRNAKIREHAVESVMSFLKNNEIRDVDFIKESLLGRICDDEPNIVLKVLSLPEKLRQLLPTDRLLDALKVVLKKEEIKNVPSLRQVKMKALEVLCSLYNLQDPMSFHILEAVFPFLFPQSQDDVSYLESIIISPLNEHPLLKNVKDHVEEIISVIKKEYKKTDITTLHSKLWIAMMESISDMDKHQKCALITHIENIENMSDCEISMCISVPFIVQTVCIEGSKDRHIGLSTALGIFRRMLESKLILNDLFIPERDLQSVAETCRKTMKNKRYPLSMVCFCLHRMITNMSLDFVIPDNQWWPIVEHENDSRAEEDFCACVDFFLFLLKYVNSKTSNVSVSFKFLIGSFVKNVLKELRNVLWFLSYIISNPPGSKITSLDSLLALRIVDSLCDNAEFCRGFFSGEVPVEFLSLLSSMASEESSLRADAMNLLQKVLSHCAEATSCYRVFGKFIHEYREEIKLDKERFFLASNMWLSAVFGKSDSICAMESSSNARIKFASEMYSDMIRLIQSETTPLYVSVFILKILEKDDSQRILNEFLPVLKRFLSQYESGALNHSKLLAQAFDLLIAKFSPIVATGFEENDKLLEIFLKLLQTSVTYDGVTDRCVQQAALKCLTKEFFTFIPSASVQRKLLDVLVCMYIELKSAEINAIVSGVLKKLCFCAYLLLKELPDNSGVALQDIASLRELKKSRNQRKDPVSNNLVDSGPWKKITVILEMIYNKKKLKDRNLLVVELFRLLHLTLDWESQPSVEYVRQLILSTIYSCCQQLEAGALQEEKFQVELVIQCIRVTENPKTHQQALLLLNLAAVMFPDYLLKNIMSIFTFMGSSLVRQDDSYSFQVISQTIETIIPALHQVSEHKDGNASQVMATVTRMFVDSIPDIPRHRQLSLFTKLVNTLGPEEYLWIPLGQICERYAYPSRFYDIYINGGKDEEDSPVMEFAMMLHEQFSITTQLETCLRLLLHLKVLPDVIDEKKSQNCLASKEPFDLNTHTMQQLQAYKKNVLCYVNQWISSPSFLALVVGSKASQALEQQYEALLEAAIIYLKDVSKPERSAFEDEVLRLLHDLLHNISSLLPCKLFVSVIRKLLKSSLPNIQLKSMEILNNKMEHQPNFFLDSESHVLKLLRPLLKIVKKRLSDENGIIPDKHLALHQQTALYSLHLMCKLVGMDCPDNFKKVLPVVVTVLCHSKTEPNLIINSLLCLADLCKCLNAHVLPYLSSFMPEVMEIMKDSVSCESEYLVLGLLTSLKGLVLNLGAFLNPYLDSILLNLCLIAERSKNNSLQLLIEKSKSLCEHISSEIAPRILFPSIKRVCQNLLEENDTAISILVSILAGRISNTDHDDLQEHLPGLRDLFMLLLSFRDESLSLSLSVINHVEDIVINSFYVLTLKLSESTFQSLYSEMYKWAVPSVFEKDAEENKSRILTFYNLSCMLARNLRTLFTPYVKKILRHAASVLDATNMAKSEVLYFSQQNDPIEKTVFLLNYVLDTLNLCFASEDNNLGDKEVFDILMQPLVDQIENGIGGDEAYQERIEKHLSTCIANFVVSFPDSTMWKSLNYQVLLKTRHSSSKVRFASLKVIREIVRKMNDNYLVLLPESIPFLAEIMEDESFEVEQECQDALVEMEKILGEPIKRYF